MKTRDDFGKTLNGGYGVELGVSQGRFSKQLLQSSNLKMLFSIDRWSEEVGVPHDYEQYLEAKDTLREFGNRSVVIMLPFAEAVHLFQDECFDFIYIDGMASTGLENGKTLYDWWPKLKNGGLFAGHDYHEHFPILIEEVDKFVEKHNLDLRLTKEVHEDNSVRDQVYPSWYFTKQ